jgi:hypothetical protein
VQPEPGPASPRQQPGSPKSTKEQLQQLLSSRPALSRSTSRARSLAGAGPDSISTSSNSAARMGAQLPAASNSGADGAEDTPARPSTGSRLSRSSSQNSSSRRLALVAALTGPEAGANGGNAAPTPRSPASARASPWSKPLGGQPPTLGAPSSNGNDTAPAAAGNTPATPGKAAKPTGFDAWSIAAARRTASNGGAAAAAQAGAHADSSSESEPEAAAGGGRAPLRPTAPATQPIGSALLGRGRSFGGAAGAGQAPGNSLGTAAGPVGTALHMSLPAAPSRARLLADSLAGRASAGGAGPAAPVMGGARSLRRSISLTSRDGDNPTASGADAEGGQVGLPSGRPSQAEGEEGRASTPGVGGSSRSSSSGATLREQAAAKLRSSLSRAARVTGGAKQAQNVSFKGV